MVDPESEQIEDWISSSLKRRNRLSEQIYGDIEPPEMLDSEDFVDEYEVDVDDEKLSVSAYMGDIEYNFNNAERDMRGALELFSGVFYTMYDELVFRSKNMMTTVLKTSR